MVAISPFLMDTGTQYRDVSISESISCFHQTQANRMAKSNWRVESYMRIDSHETSVARARRILQFTWPHDRNTFLPQDLVHVN
ncbi:hypothetical protein M0802_012322 [Mischocyttarus mexicanus]|nr:hypothetical protein M0802_012322 [Mischocyttarus mexicanus]